MTITFETAKLGKEKGFKDNECKQYNRIGTHIYESIASVRVLSDLGFVIPAPTQSELQKWLREVHKIDVLVVNYYKDYSCTIKKTSDQHRDGKMLNILESSFEVALEKGLQEALNLINL